MPQQASASGAAARHVTAPGEFQTKQATNQAEADRNGDQLSSASRALCSLLLCAFTALLARCLCSSTASPAHSRPAKVLWHNPLLWEVLSGGSAICTLPVPSPVTPSISCMPCVPRVVHVDLAFRPKHGLSGRVCTAFAPRQAAC
ncbi:hypothetical protein VTN96DRAFT_7505 [Rasamsonia emersonii]